MIGPNRFVENAVGGNVASSAMMHWGYNYIATLIWQSATRVAVAVYDSTSTEGTSTRRVVLIETVTIRPIGIESRQQLNPPVRLLTPQPCLPHSQGGSWCSRCLSRCRRSQALCTSWPTNTSKRRRPRTVTASRRPTCSPVSVCFFRCEARGGSIRVQTHVSWQSLYRTMSYPLHLLFHILRQHACHPPHTHTPSVTCTGASDLCRNVGHAPRQPAGVVYTPRVVRERCRCRRERVLYYIFERRTATVVKLKANR